ncbi:MAG: class I SAM-dependent methyltransferase [Candidatus Aenigmarchaeota archaeon]|nr:class I SAM-dependent methyltransferase [Candidatus Aenigmarchaeota archaeon]
MEKVVDYYAKTKLRTFEKELLKREVKKRGKILDLCCGTGRVAFPMAKRGFYVIGVDNSKKMIKKAEDIARKNKTKNIKFLCNDATKIEFEKEAFDYILLMDSSLPFILSKEKREKIFKTAYVALKTDGKIIVSLGSFLHPKTFALLNYWNAKNIMKKLLDGNYPMGLNDMIVKSKKYDVDVFLHYFTPYEFMRLVKKAGFTRIRFYTENELLGYKNKQLFKSLLDGYYVIQK